MDTDRDDHRIKALRLVLPLLAACFFSGALVIEAHPMESGPAAIGFGVTGIFLAACYILLRRYNRLTRPVGNVTIMIVSGVVIARVFQLNQTFSASDDTELVSLFFGIYAYIPIVYLLAFMLLDKSDALRLSLVVWATLGTIVIYFNGSDLVNGPWREGLDHVVLVVALCQPLFIALIYRVPPYAAALKLAQQETSKVREALGKMADIAATDVLTNLHNRRFLKSFWDEFNHSNVDEPQYLSMLVLDIDYFKQYNDTAGHIAGDTCLIRIADVVKRLANLHNGHAIRYGGEEFLVLLPSSAPQNTNALAEKFRTAIAHLKIPHPAVGMDWVTISIGATYGTNLDVASEATWVRAADSALYEAKRSGRNCSKFRMLTA